MSIRIDVYSPGGTLLGHGTAFRVERGGQSYLITNRHLVTGKNENNEYGKLSDNIPPETMHVNYRLPLLGNMHTISEPLYDEEEHQPLWYEHPAYGRRVDVVALRIEHINPLDLAAITKLTRRNTTRVA